MLNISNLIQISVNVAPTGLATFNVNNVALFSNEVPVNDPGDYGVYISASEVATDWGTGSETYQQALAFFSQSPNPLNGGGALIIFPMNTTTAGQIASAVVYDAGSGYSGTLS